MVPVSTLEALARAADHDARARSRAWMDAQRGEVFAALYDARDERLIAPPTSLTPDATLDALADAEIAVADSVSSATARCDTRTSSAHAARWHGRSCLPCRAWRGSSDRSPRGRAAPRGLPHAVVPIYVRRPDAELARDRRHGSSDRVTALGRCPNRRIGRSSRPRRAPTSTPSRRWKRRRSPTRGRARCWRGSSSNPTSRASTCCAGPAGAVAAFCACWVIVDELHINTLAVDPELRRQRSGDDADVGRCWPRPTPRRASRRRWRSGSRTRRHSRLYEKLGFSVVAVRLALLHATGGGRADPVAGRAPSW